MFKTHHTTNLRTEYTDIKDITHKVEHFIASNKDDNNKERIVEELFHVLTRPGKRVPYKSISIDFTILLKNLS